MNIVCVYGSPRPKGNSATIANRFIESATESGANVKKFELNKLDYRGCQGCMTCKGKTGKCLLDDDMTEVIEAVRETDILVIATPVYYSYIPGPLKTFIDRTWAFVKPDYMTNPVPTRLEPGKKMVFIQTQGAEDENIHKDVYQKIEKFFELYGFKDIRTILACGVNAPGEVKRLEDVMELADKTACELMAA
ncbi:flavodoxin family protein [Desulfococcaceae bacterium HSG8]|nr:flavodoxin family protein [Desulfococcaceae bacterium HSG8]